MLSAYYGHADLVKLLIQHGADPNRLNDKRQSPLAGAVFKKLDNVVDVSPMTARSEAGSLISLGSPGRGRRSGLRHAVGHAVRHYVQAGKVGSKIRVCERPGKGRRCRESRGKGTGEDEMKGSRAENLSTIQKKTKKPSESCLPLSARHLRGISGHSKLQKAVEVGA